VSSLLESLKRLFGGGSSGRAPEHDHDHPEQGSESVTPSHPQPPEAAPEPERPPES
jgi:hypothetical protein